MKFVVSSSAIIARLQSLSRVVPPKPQLPILENLLFHLEDNVLSITASDLETTFRASLPIENVQEGGSVAIPARLLGDSLKDFPEQPLTFSWDPESTSMEITWSTGKFQVPVFPAADFPEYPTLKENPAALTLPAQTLLTGINRCLYAAADEELRPVMNGIFFDINMKDLTLVASDARKLVCYHRDDIVSEITGGFILPKKPANLLRNLLPKTDQDITIRFDDKNVYIKIDGNELYSRLVEGVYPAYRSVIPKNNENKATVDRLELLKAVRRVAVCANQGSNLIRLAISNNEILISASDLDFNVAAYDRVNCQFEGTSMEIGFKSVLLAEILDNLPGQETCMALSDPARAGLFSPSEQTEEHEDICALLMPMMLS